MRRQPQIKAQIVVCLFAVLCAGHSRATASNGEVTKLSDHVSVYRGATNVGIVRDGARALLIDCGEGGVAEVLPTMGITSVDEVWFTHHHRDTACGASQFADRSAKLRVPAAEKPYFDIVAAYWNDPKSRWHIYDFHPHHLMLAESVCVDGTLSNGQTQTWGPAKITVIATPGHTDGSVSFLIAVDGKRIVFCGDAIYDAGQLWDLWSLQKKNPDIWADYHGFLGTRQQLERSLQQIVAEKPDALVPSHGKVVGDPPAAVDLLVRRLDTAYDRYVAISALRHYFPKMFTAYAGKPGHMPIRPGKPVPNCLRHFGTTWVLVSKDKAALAMDCGTQSAVKTLQEMLDKGDIRSVEGLWITHYHDDHVNAVPAFQKAFPGCPCITDSSVADVISNPMAWRLPCISPSVARVDRSTTDGESWHWHEFKLTAYHFPGQTLYHAGLLVEGRGLKMFFAGDSFTMAGIDDYCMQNRDWLGRGVGFDRCIALLDKLRPPHILNCHVDKALDFTENDRRFMRANLAEREKLFGELVPWDHANYGMDDSWARCFPYEQQAKAGADFTMQLVFTNHSSQPRTASCRLVLPRVWDGTGTAATWPDAAKIAMWPSAQIPAKSDGRIALRASVPTTAKPGRYIVPIDIRYGDWRLPQFREAIVEVK